MRAESSDDAGTGSAVSSDRSRAKSFSRTAANVSWVCPLVTILILIVLISTPLVPRRMIAMVASGALCLVAVGLVSGIVALFGIPRHGSKGILRPAMVGITINGLLLSFIVANFLTAKFRAVEQPGGIPAATLREPSPAGPSASA